MNRIARIFRCARLAKAKCQKSFWRQLVDIIRLRFKKNALGVTEYFDMELFDDKKYPWVDKGKFIGHRYSVYLDQRLNDISWNAIESDKIVNYSILQHYGFPIPRIYATYNKHGRHVFKETVLTEIDEVKIFLTSRCKYPLFAKPIHSSSGLGVMGIKEVDSHSGLATLINNEQLELPKILTSFQNEHFGGMMFQELLVCSQEIAEIFGSRLSTFRVIVLLTDKGPRLHLAFWKIAREFNMVDNFHFGQYGNMLGWIDIQAGILTKIIRSFWPDNDEIIYHPDTKKRMKGFAISQWNELKDICLGAAIHFPGIKIQSWDIALSESGPVMIELNTGADLEIPQSIAGMPFMDEYVKALLSKP